MKGVLRIVSGCLAGIAATVAVPATAGRVTVPDDVTRIDFDVTAKQGRVAFHFGEKEHLDTYLAYTDHSIRGKAIKDGALRLEPFQVTYPIVTDRANLTYDTVNGVFRDAAGAAVAPETPLRLVYSIRRRPSGAAFYMNGNYLGERPFGFPLSSFDAPEGVPYVFGREPAADPLRFETVEYPAEITFPGAWSNAAVKLTAKTGIPLPRVTGANADLGLAAEKTPDHRHGQKSLWRVDKYTALKVPAAEYVKAHVLCALDTRPSLDRAFTVRLTTYAGDGRCYDGMMNKLVEFDAAKKRVVGRVTVGGTTRDLYLVEVPIDTGKIQDIVHTDTEGWWEGVMRRNRFGRYLDFEILGRCYANFSPLGSWSVSRQNPDRNRPSAVHVFGATLEKPGAEFLVDEIVAGNVFHNDEKPETAMKVFVRRPGAYRLAWTIRDAFSNVVSRTARDFSSDARFVADLAQRDPGWYQIDWTLSEGDGTPFLTHRGAFALLGKDTRTTGAGEGPFCTWGTGNHLTTQDPDVLGSLVYKAGIRRGLSEHNKKINVPEMTTRWKFTPSMTINVQRRGWLNLHDRNWYFHGTNEAQVVANIRERIAKYPAVTCMQLLWEDADGFFCQAPELIGEKPGEDHKGLADVEQRVKTVREVSDIIRRNFPGFRIMLGNTGSCSEIIAEQIRAGLPESAIDYLGVEAISRSALPERQCGMNYLAVECLVETARNMGYRNWKAGGCIESNSRVDDLIGEDNQAKWLVRDALVGLLWEFPDINLGGIIEAGNYYTETLWGKDGLCRRSPCFYPKKAYVGYATLTKVMDRTTDAKLLETGDPCVFLAEFPRKDGKVAYALWTARGEAKVRIRTRGAISAIDFFGKPFEPAAGFGNLVPGGKSWTFRASTWPQYFLTDGPGVRSAEVRSRAFPEDPVPVDLRLAAKTDDISKWTLRKTPDEHIELTKGRFLPYRKHGVFSLKAVNDAERGTCLELALAKPDLTLPKMMSEYGEIELKEPIVIEGKPKSMGLWVKGNSGWGKIYFILEDAKGRRRVSCGTRLWGGDCFDYSGRMSVDFTGWNFLTMPIATGSSIPAWSTGSYANLWEYGKILEDGRVARGPDWDEIAWPVKFVGVAYDVSSRPLDICERHARPQSIRVGSIGFYDFDR